MNLLFIGNNGLDARGFFYKVIIANTLGPYWDTLRLNHAARQDSMFQKVVPLSSGIQIFLYEVFYFASRVAFNSETTKKAYDFATTDLVDMSFYRVSCFNVCPGITRQTLSGSALF